MERGRNTDINTQLGNGETVPPIPVEKIHCANVLPTDAPPMGLTPDELKNTIAPKSVTLERNPEHLVYSSLALMTLE